jgi:hypothetical protein
MGAVLVAKKKTARPATKTSKAEGIAVVVRGSPEWKAWVLALAKHARLDVAKVIDRALIDFAAKEGFEVEAPER